MPAFPEPTDSLNTSPSHPTPSPAFPSPPQMTTPTTTAQSAADIERWQSVFYRSSIAMCILCPAVMLMPPRKADLYTLGLGVTFFLSAGYVSEVRTGHGLLWHVGNGLPKWNRHRVQMQEDGTMKKVWIGQEEGMGDWVEKRKREEQEALEEGRGYGGLIGDYAKEAFGREKKE